VKEIFFDDTPENFLSKEGISKFFSTSRKLSVEILTVFGSGAAGGANCLLLPATVNVKLGPPLGIYFSCGILLVFSSFFAFFGVFVGDLGF